jgi:hypothetical protein
MHNYLFGVVEFAFSFCHVHTQVGYFSSFTVLLIICLPSGLQRVDGFVKDVVLVYESQIWHTKEYDH